jgi:hypothetical protein
MAASRQGMKPAAGVRSIEAMRTPLRRRLTHRRLPCVRLGVERRRELDALD